VGGRIEVASEHGKGSTFRFFIKAKACHTSKRPAEDDGDNLEMVESKPALGKRSTNFKPMFPAGLKPHVLNICGPTSMYCVSTAPTDMPSRPSISAWSPPVDVPTMRSK
jgi:hypothetical protein